MAPRMCGVKFSGNFASKFEADFLFHSSRLCFFTRSRWILLQNVTLRGSLHRRFQPGAELKFCSDYMEKFSPGLKIFSPVLFWFYLAGKFFGCLKRKYSVFVIYFWAMYHFSDVNSSVNCNNYYVRVTRKEKEICCE